MAHPEGVPEQDQTMIVHTAHILRVLGKLPGGLADADAVRLAAMAHGLTLGKEDGIAGFHTPAAESYPYSAGQDYATDGTGQLHYDDGDRASLATGEQLEAASHDTRSPAQRDTAGTVGQETWPTRGWAAEAVLRGLPAGRAGARDRDDQKRTELLGAPAASETVVDKWAIPAGSYREDETAADAANTDVRLIPDGKRRQSARTYRPERKHGFKLGVRSIAVISVASLAAVIAGGAAFVDHKRHVDFNRAVQSTVSVPDYIPLGTEARTILAGDVDVLQQALVDPAISAEAGNSLQGNRVYNQKLGALPMAILLQVGGGDPKTSGYPGVIWPLPPQVYEQDYRALVASEKARGEALSPNDPNNPATDARVVAFDMNRFFAQHYQSGEMPSINTLAAAYGAYEATRLGAPRQGASDFGQSTANLVAQWKLSQAQYLSLPVGSRQFAALAKDTTWLSHEGAVANKGIK